jgi:hypothetical protein
MDAWRRSSIRRCERSETVLRLSGENSTMLDGFVAVPSSRTRLLETARFPRAASLSRCRVSASVCTFNTHQPKLDPRRSSDSPPFAMSGSDRRKFQAPLLPVRPLLHMQRTQPSARKAMQPK